MRLNVAYWHKRLAVGLYGSFRHGPRFENRQTGLTLCSYGNGDGKVTQGDLQSRGNCFSMEDYQWTRR